MSEEVETLKKELQVMRDCCHEMRSVNKELSLRFNQVATQLEKLADRLDGMVNFKLELAKKDVEHDANVDVAISTAKRSHERIDKVEQNLSRAVWLVLTVVIIAVMANVGISK